MLDVLLVEDNEDHARLTTLMLESPPGHFRVIHAKSLAAARQALTGITFDVMLLDLILPDGDGRDLLAEAHRRVPRLPVIITSSLDDRDTVEELLRAGADDFIGKGTFTDPLALQNHIWNVVNVRRCYRDVIDIVERSRKPAVEGVAANA